MPRPNARNLLITFDAFGTLFKPRLPIPLQYIAVAEEHGVMGLTEKQVSSSFKEAFAEGRKLFPNYGKSVGMRPTEWWERVIKKTLEPLAPDGLTPDIISDLIRRFSTSAGYELYSDVIPCLEFLQFFRSRQGSFWPYDTVTVGVVTNSDSRVVSILNSLSIGVRSFTPKTSWDEGLWTDPKEILPPKRKAGRPRKKPLVEPKLEIDFVVLSCDVGVEKPHHQIFREAERMAKECRNLEGPWARIHLGDDLEKDYYGAKLAGWKAVLVCRDGNMPENRGVATVRDFRSIRQLGGNLL
ncbi:HAD-like domain-containing protein [Tuber brumale]|nr:HAD-like domain-containing protein [Tuber brumale]